MRAEVCSTQPHRIAKAAEQTMFFFLLVLVGDLPFYRLKRVYKYSSTVPCEPKVTKNTGTNVLQVKLSQKCPKSPVAPNNFGIRYGDVAITCIRVLFLHLQAHRRTTPAIDDNNDLIHINLYVMILYANIHCVSEKNKTPNSCP